METVEIVVQPNITNVAIAVVPNVTEVAIAIAPLGLKGEKGDGFSNYQSFDITDPQATIFVLNSIPKQYSLTLAFLNGVKLKYGTDYTINGTLLSYISTTVPLKQDFILEIQY